MAIRLTEAQDGKVLEVLASGTLTREDYAALVPKVERSITRHGKINVLFEMADFHGWTAGALWEDLKFDLHHFAEIDRLALVGNKRWEQGMSVFCRPFTTATVRYFDIAELITARAWVERG